MFSLKAFLSFVLISLVVVDANPLSRRTGKATLNLATRINTDGPLNIVEKNRARADQALRNVGHLDKRSTSVDITNVATIYSAQVGVGSPPTEYTLMVDTGSSNTWVGAGKSYVQTNTSKDTGNTVLLYYSIGNMTGEEWIDTVTLAPGLVIEHQSIGVARSASGAQGFDGILGLGPVDLTNDTISNTGTVPTVMDNLYHQGTIPEEVLGVYFIPFSVSNSGTLTFGGVDDSVITSSVNYVPLTMTFPASTFWGINQSISYDGATILEMTAGIIDTGTTFILIATDAFQKYQSATGATLDSTTGMLTITSSQYANLKTLSFHIGGRSYDLSPNAQIWPRSLNSVLGGDPNSIYLVINDIGSLSGSGLDFINGYAFLEYYYSVFDTTNGRVGFATTAYTNSNNN